jgi:hypothetical protein
VVIKELRVVCREDGKGEEEECKREREREYERENSNDKKSYIVVQDIIAVPLGKHRTYRTQLS